MGYFDMERYRYGSDGISIGGNLHVLAERNLLDLKAQFLLNFALQQTSSGSGQPCDVTLMNRFASRSVTPDCLDAYIQTRGIGKLEIALSPTGEWYCTILP